MQKVDLNEVLEMLINEEHEEATGLVHEWLVQMFKSVNESLMSEDDAAQGIADDQDAIESEEFYSEADGDDVDDMGDEAPVDDMGDEAAEPETVEVDKSELQAVMDNLFAEFTAILNGDEVGGDEMPTDDMGEMPADDMDAEMDGEMPSDDEALMMGEADESVVEDDDDDFADLEESFNLEAVADPAMVDGKEIGKGAKVSQNTKSPIPMHKVADRAMKGEPVEIHAKEYNGHDLETAPEVKTKPLLKNQVKKAMDGQSSVSKEGDKSAMLNKNDGFGSDSPKSPIPGMKKGK